VLPPSILQCATPSITKEQIAPLHVAAECGKEAVVKLLLEKNAEILIPEQKAVHPISCCCRKWQRNSGEAVIREWGKCGSQRR
jgi:hypothetical protein